MGSKKSSPEPVKAPAPQPAPPSALEVAQAQQQAQMEYALPAQQLAFQNLQDPTSGLQAQTQLGYDTRREVFSDEAQVADALRNAIQQGLSDPSGQLQQLLGGAQQVQTGLEGITPQQTEMQQALIQQIMGQLQSPTGLTEEQTVAQEGIRQREADRLQRGIQTSANLGGGLFGGRRELREDTALSQLGQQYAAEDIDRITQQRQFAQQQAAQQQAAAQQAQQFAYGSAANQQQTSLSSAFPFLQMMFPGVGMQAPQFESPVPTAASSLAAALQGRGQDVSTAGQGLQADIANQNLAAQQQNQLSPLQQILYSGLGTAVNTAAGGLATKIPGVS